MSFYDPSEHAREIQAAAAAARLNLMRMLPDEMVEAAKLDPYGPLARQLSGDYAIQDAKRNLPDRSNFQRAQEMLSDLEGDDALDANSYLEGCAKLLPNLPTGEVELAEFLQRRS